MTINIISKLFKSRLCVSKTTCRPMYMYSRPAEFLCKIWPTHIGNVVKSRPIREMYESKSNKNVQLLK